MMTNKRTVKGLPPAKVELIYQKVGQHSHVFTATSVPGFYYGSTSLERTFNEVARALGVHISRLYNTPATYQLATSLTEFRNRLKTEIKEDDAEYISELLLKNSVIANMASGVSAQH
jgi:hypothetical protein